MEQHATEAPDDSVDLARWLCEVGERTGKPRAPFVPMPPDEAGGAEHRQRGLLFWTIAATSLAAAYLQYFYLDVLLEILSLPSLLVFALSSPVS